MYWKRILPILFLALTARAQQSHAPGIIQAEDYDPGGEGVAYHDNTPGNTGGAYRSDDVDIEPNGEGGYNVGWIEDEEWLRYTFNATNDFTNIFRCRIASAWPYDPFAIRLSIDDETVDVLNLYHTGGWQAWTNVYSSRPFHISQGIHTLRVDFIIGGFNLDEIEFVNYTNPLPLYMDATAAVTARVADLLDRMTLDEMLGQMCLVDVGFLTKSGSEERDITTYFIGALLNGADTDPPANTPKAWADMTDRYQGYALATRLHIPVIYGVDAVHGHNNVFGATIFPHNIGMGATRNEALIERAAQVTAVEVAATGIDWTFAPCIAVPRNEQWGRFYEGFAETPELVGRCGAAAIRGFQGSDLSAVTTILACAKHFAGDGGTTWGTGTNGGIDRGDVVLDEATFRAIHLAPYSNAVAAGVKSIMASYSSWNGVKMHGHSNMLTQVLKGELGFEGFIVSDWGGIDDVAPGDYKSAIVTSINAGIDMVMVPDRYEEFLSLLKEAVTNGLISTNRVRDAVKRILNVKFQLGLFEKPYAERKLLDRVGCAEHRAVAREAVRQSLVVLKNKGSILPLRKDLAHIHVAGKNADNLGYQCGGWSMSWQGGSGDITIGTTIYEAITNAVSAETLVTYSEDGSGAGDADVGIVVVGETPYAEYCGDTQDLSLDSEDLAAIERVRTSGVPVVVVLVTGRPLIVEPALTNWDALVVAWLPGTEGEGVADVLFGDYYPHAKLPHSWPRSESQIPINIGDQPYDPLYVFDHGLGIEPGLEIRETGNMWTFTWPYGSTGFVLQQSTSLVGNAGWTDVPGSPILTGKTYRMTIEKGDADQMYYRLIRP